MFTVASQWNVQATATQATQFFLLLMPLLMYGSLEAEVPTSAQNKLSHRLDAFELTLSNEKKHCQLQVKKQSADASKTIPLLLEPPCYWVVNNESKDLLHYDYEAVEADNTLLVAGTTLDWAAEKKAYQKLPDNAFCSQYLQGIVISKGDVFAVDEKMIAAHCETGLGMDEKIFYAMAHNPKRYQEKNLEAIEATVEIQSAVKTSPIDTKPKNMEEKSFFDSVTDSIKELFSGTTEDAK